MRFSITDFIAKNKTNIIITILVIVSILLLLKFPAKNNIITKTFLNDEEVEYDDTLISDKNDSLEKYGLCAIENIIIEANTKVRRTQNIATYNSLYELKFGTKVYTKVIDKENENHIYVDASLVDRETKNGFVAIYAVKPITLSEKPVGYVAVQDIILKSEFKNFKSKPKRIVIEASILAAIESNLVLNGTTYKFIEDNKRYNNSITYGDYNNDGAIDFAIILDTPDNADSVFLVFFIDAEKKNYRLIFTNKATSYLKINTIPKQTPIIFKSETTSFPYDGIQITTNETNPFYYFYTANTNSFTPVKN